MSRSERTYRTGKFFLILGIVFAFITAITAIVHCMDYSWMPFELLFELPFAVLLEYVLIGAGMTVIFLGIAWIFYGVAGKQMKTEQDALVIEDDAVLEEFEEFEEFKEPAVCISCAPYAPCQTCQIETPIRKKTRKRKRVTVAGHDVTRYAVDNLVIPAVVAGVLAVSLAMVSKKSEKAKRRHDFYRWLG